MKDDETNSRNISNAQASFTGNFEAVRQKLVGFEQWVLSILDIPHHCHRIECLQNVKLRCARHIDQIQRQLEEKISTDKKLSSEKWANRMTNITLKWLIWFGYFTKSNPSICIESRYFFCRIHCDWKQYQRNYMCIDKLNYIVWIKERKLRDILLRWAHLCYW